MKFIWKEGLSFTTANAYSATLLQTVSEAFCHTTLAESYWHTATHCPQPTHFSESICAILSLPTTTASWAQYFSQILHPVQFSSNISGEEPECRNSFPPTDAQPIPRFLRAPPNPVISCPLKWFIEIITSASAIALPIFATEQYSRFNSISR